MHIFTGQDFQDLFCWQKVCAPQLESEVRSKVNPGHNSYRRSFCNAWDTIFLWPWILLPKITSTKSALM